MIDVRPDVLKKYDGFTYDEIQSYLIHVVFIC